MGPDVWGVNRNQNVAGEGWEGHEGVTLNWNIGCKVKTGGYDLASPGRQSSVLTVIELGHLRRSVIMMITPHIRRQPKSHALSLWRRR